MRFQQGVDDSPTRALISRVYAAPRVFNSIFTDFGGDLVNIDATSGVHFTNGVAKLQNNVWWNLKLDGTQVMPTVGSTGEWVLTTPSNNNLVADPMLRGISRTNVPAYQLDLRLKAGSPALTNSPAPAPDDGFYSAVTYSGAFGAVNWASDWTFAAEVGLITGEGAGEPRRATGGAKPPLDPATLQVRRVGAGVEVSFSSQSGYSYQAQTRTSLTSGDWKDSGAPAAGTGGVLTVTFPGSEGIGYVRIVGQ